MNQPLTQSATSLPNIRSVPDMQVVEVKGDFYIALNGKWTRLYINESLYGFYMATGTISAATDIPIGLSKGNIGLVNASGVLTVQKRSVLKISATFQLDVASSTTTDATISAAIELNGSVLDKHTLGIPANNVSGVMSFIYLKEFSKGDEIKINLSPDTHSFSYTANLIIEEV